MTDLDCEQVLAQVWSYLDGELDQSLYLQIRAHVARCTDCGPRFEFQRRLLAVLEQKCKEGPVPMELKQRLFRLLDE